jgi:hypothetical protein
MTTNKQLIDIADQMADSLKKLTDGLAKDGVAIEGFTNAIAIQKKWAEIKLKRELERFCARQNIKIPAVK